MSNAKIILGHFLTNPNYKYQEHLLGYETDLICLKGISADKVHMEKIPNTRQTNHYLEQLIDQQWEETIKKNPKAFDCPRARFEGSLFDNDTGVLHIKWSDERYKTHAILRDVRLPQSLPKPYQANLYTINGIPFTEDNKIPIVTRNPKHTDQGKIRHIIPSGFVDIKEIDSILRAENVSETVMRKLFDELNLPNSYAESPHTATSRELKEELKYCKKSRNLPIQVFKPEDMRILGIVYNSFKNFDYTVSALIPLKTNSKKIILKGKEHKRLEWIKTDFEELKSFLLEISAEPDTTSGHLRGDIALTIGHLYGEEAYKEALDHVTNSLIKRCLN